MREGEAIPIPAEDADWLDIWNYALTYKAYDRDGGLGGAAEIGNRCAEAWQEDGSLPDEFGTARAALFFEQRRYRHFGDDPTGPSEVYVRALVRRIADLSGGKVDGCPDPLP